MKNDETWGSANFDNRGNANKDYAEFDRSKTNEIQEGSVVIEIYEKLSDQGDRLFFDLRYSREFTLRDTRERKRGPYLHQRDIGDLIIASISAQKWINIRVRQFRSER